MSSGLTHFVDSELLNGSGVGRPLGLLNALCKIAIAKESGQAAATITWNNLTQMMAASSSPENGTWLVNRKAHEQLLHLQEFVGAGGSVVGPPTKDASGQLVFLGRPMRTTDVLPALGTEGDVMFCDLSQYYFGLRSGIRVTSSQHLYFQKFMTAFRVVIRCDGAPVLNSSITGADGNSYSPVMTLATRA